MRSLPKGFIFPYGDGTGDPVDVGYHGSVAPHPLTVRRSYAVPGGKVALLVSSGMNMMSTVNAVGGRSARGLIQVEREGRAPVEIAHLHHTIDNQFVVVGIALVHHLVLFSRDTVNIITEDLSVAGEMQYNIMCALTEFDS